MSLLASVIFGVCVIGVIVSISSFVYYLQTDEYGYNAGKVECAGIVGLICAAAAFAIIAFA